MAVGRHHLGDGERVGILTRYADSEITAEHAADLLGPGTAIVDVVLETRERLRRLPDVRNAFTESEYHRALAMLRLGTVQV